jgi:uncharacterized protein (TIRG00374 family)
MTASCQLARFRLNATPRQGVWQAAAMAPDSPNPPAGDVIAPKATLDKRKSIILGVVGLAFIVLIFWRVIPQVGSYSDAVKALQNMGVVAIALIVFMVVVYLLAYGLPFKAATPGLKFWPSEQVNQSAFAISNGVPAGGAVGLAVQYGMITSYRISGTSATAAITAVSLWSTFVTLGLPILGVLALTLAGKGSGGHIAVALIGLVVLTAAVLAFVLIMRSAPLARRVGEIANKALGPLRSRIKKLQNVNVVEPIVNFRSNMYDLLKRRWAVITGAQIAVSLTQFLILYVALRGIQGWDKEGTSILVVFGAFAISQLGLMVPVTPGGLGTVDAVMIALLTANGVSSGEATAADLVWRASSYVPQIILGIFAILIWYRRAGKRFASVAAPAGS